MRKKLRVLFALLGVIGIMAGTALVASVDQAASLTPLHTGHLTGTASCQTNGTYTVTYVPTTTNVPAGDTAHVTLDTVTGGGTLQSGLPQDIVGNTTGTSIVYTGVPGSTTSTYLKIDLAWTGADTYNGTADTTVTMPGPCVAQVGSITVTKLSSSSAPLAGAVFTLSGGPTSASPETTGVSGIVTFSNLLYGTYTVTETTAPTGYSLPSPAFQTAVVGANSVNVSVTFSDTAIPTTTTTTTTPPKGTPTTTTPPTTVSCPTSSGCTLGTPTTVPAQPPAPGPTPTGPLPVQQEVAQAAAGTLPGNG